MRDFSTLILRSFVRADGGSKESQTRAKTSQKGEKAGFIYGFCHDTLVLLCVLCIGGIVNVLSCPCAVFVRVSLVIRDLPEDNEFEQKQKNHNKPKMGVGRNNEKQRKRTSEKQNQRKQKWIKTEALLKA